MTAVCLYQIAIGKHC